MRGAVNQPRRSRIQAFHDWVEDRLEIDEIWLALFKRKIPFGVNLFYTLGFASIAVFLVQAITGSVLAMYYSPSPDHAYDSVQYVMAELPYGEVIRGIHHWGASAMVAVVALHLLVVFVMGAYKYPREMTWVVGVLLFLVVMGLGFTGYLLPWDEKAYWATTVGTNIAGTMPIVGGFVVRVLRGGADLGALTLARFYASHVLLLPMALVGLIAMHVFMVIRQGVSVPPGLWDREGKKRTLGHPLAARPASLDGSEYHERYHRFKVRGRPFFPDLIFEDTLVSVLVILIVIGFAVAFGVPLDAQADPSNTSYVPRPEWYFLFLFEMLKYFPGALEWVGALVIPGVFIILLLILPFLSRSALRSPSARPLSMFLGGLAIIAVAFLTVRAIQLTPPTVVEERGVRLSAAEVAGKQLVDAQNCTGCHLINNKGSEVGPSLDGIGSRRDPAYIHTYIENPKGLNPSTRMPAYIPPLSHAQVEEITRYLLTLK